MVSVKNEFDTEEWLRDWAEDTDDKNDIKDVLKSELDYGSCDRDVVPRQTQSDLEERDWKTKALDRSHPKERNKKGKVNNFDLNRRIQERINACKDFSDSIGNKCKYLCPLCCEEFTQHTKARQHRLKEHQGQNVNIVDFFSRIVCHVCRICSTSVVCDYRYLVVHMKRKHNVTVRSYAQDYDVESDCREFPRKYTKEVLDSLLQKSSESTDFVGNFCVFECYGCKRELGTLDSLLKHKTQFKHAQKPLIQSAVKIVTHSCRLCGKKLISDQYFLKSHLNTHKLSLSRYALKFQLVKTGGNFLGKRDRKTFLEGIPLTNKVGDYCTFACKSCKKNFNSSELLKDHFKKTLHHKSRVSTYTIHNFITSSVGHVCKLCGKTVLCNLFYVLQHLNKSHNMKSFRRYGKEVRSHFADSSRNPENSEVIGSLPCSPNVENKCNFICLDCPQKTKSWKLMMKHLKNSHSDKQRKAKAVEYCDLRRGGFSYECEICVEKTLCDEFVFLCHLKSSHAGMWLATYKRSYCKKGVSDEEVSDRLGDLCRYTCSGCQMVFSKANALLDHLKLTGHVENFTLPSEELMTRRVVHRCRICHAKQRCEIAHLTAHTKKFHGLSLNQYARRCGVEFQSDKPLRKAYVEIRRRLVEPVLNYPQSFVFPRQEEVSTDCVGSLSTFQCTECDVGPFHRWLSLRKHLEREHPGKSNKFPTAYVAEAVHHRCLLCRKRYLCDSAFVRAHITNNHKNVRYATYLYWVKQIGGVCFPAMVNVSGEKGDGSYMDSLENLMAKVCVVRLKRLHFD